jgi:hypothetical protein
LSRVEEKLATQESFSLRAGAGLILATDALSMKRILFAVLFAGIVFLSGYLSEIGEDMAIKEVGLHGGQFAAYTIEDLKAMLTTECEHVCVGMEYEYGKTKYAVYEEGGMYVARNSKCICYDPNYGLPLEVRK